MRVPPGQLTPRRRPTRESEPGEPSSARGERANNAREQLARARQHLEHARERLAARTRGKEPPRKG